MSPRRPGGSRMQRRGVAWRGVARCRRDLCPRAARAARRLASSCHYRWRRGWRGQSIMLVALLLPRTPPPPHCPALPRQPDLQYPPRERLSTENKRGAASRSVQLERCACALQYTLLSWSRPPVRSPAPGPRHDLRIRSFSTSPAKHCQHSPPKPVRRVTLFIRPRTPRPTAPCDAGDLLPTAGI